jgi:hypothetical protein
MNLCHRSSIDGPALESELLFENTKFLEPLELLQRIARGTNRVGDLIKPKDLTRGRADVPMRFEIEVESMPDRRLARTVIPNQQNRGLA